MGGQDTGAAGVEAAGYQETYRGDAAEVEAEGTFLTTQVSGEAATHS